MKRIKLGALEVSEQGLGLMGMSEFRGRPGDWDESIATIRRAIDLGVTFLDTADVYGAGHNEVLLGRAIHGLRERVEIATKFGIDRSQGDSAWKLRGNRAYCRKSCDSSLMRLGTDYIDIYYLHFPPQDVEIEETIDAMAELVKEGKVLAIGLSNAPSEIIRRACSVHPIAALQGEYSLWERRIEDVSPVLAEFGVGLVAYAPLGRGLLSGMVKIEKLDDMDFRRRNPRFEGEAAAAHQTIIDNVNLIATHYGAPSSHVALAWVHAQIPRLGINIVPIPGTKTVKWLVENVEALSLKLASDDLTKLNKLAAGLSGDFSVSHAKRQS